MRKRYIMLLSFLLLGMAYSVYAQIATSCIPNPSQPWCFDGTAVRLVDGTTSLTLPTNTNSTGDLTFGNGFGIKSTVGASIKTGPGGGTFQIRPGSAVANIAQFLDSNDIVVLNMDPVGKLGIGTVAPVNRLDVTGTNSQIRFGSTAVDSGGYLISTSAHQAILSAGGTWNGANWIAKDTSASQVNLTSGVLDFKSDTGLTIGNSFTPTSRFSVSASGAITGAANAIPDSMLSTNVPLKNARNTYADAQEISNTAPILELNETDQAVDTKRWRFLVSGSDLQIQTINDANNAVLATVARYTRGGLLTAGRIPAVRLRNNADTANIFDTSDNMIEVGNITQNAVLFASLPASTNGTQIYCSDCTFANPCASGGTGAFAKRLNGAWRCD